MILCMSEIIQIGNVLFHTYTNLLLYIDVPLTAMVHKITQVINYQHTQSLTEWVMMLNDLSQSLRDWVMMSHYLMDEVYDHHEARKRDRM